MTSETVPSFSSQCQLINATECAIWIEWNLDISSTTIGVHRTRALSTKDPSQDMIAVRALMNMKSDNVTLSLLHNVDYYCQSTDKCNNETSLKKILRSLVIEDQFRQQLSPLLKVVPSFDAKAAACFDYKNVTDEPCPSTDLNNCQRCEISVEKTSSSNEQVCATCSSSSFPTNTVGRGKMFLLNNRTQYTDYTVLDCQLNGCNSIDNNNQIYNASKITFNFDEFFQI